MTGRRWIAASAALTIACSTALLTTASGVSAAPHRSIAQHTAAKANAANAFVKIRSAHGVHVQKVERIGGRQLQVTIKPRALKRSIGVRIILPRGYAHSTKRYPSLYLFPGTSGHSTDWATSGDAVKTTRPYGLITISSDIGIDGDGGSWFTNWINTHTKLGPSQWETYDIHELIPWIDANLKTIRTRSERAIAGLSMGGYGAMELTARHPDLFTMASSFSGAPEIDRSPDARVGAAAIIDATMVGLNGVPADSPFGNHVKNEINWQGHDPARLIENLRGIKLWLATGDGRPGVFDDPVTDPSTAVGGGVIESLARISTDHFHKRLVRLNIPSHYWYYGAGTHSFPYWARDFRHDIKPIMRRFAHPIGKRTHVHYTSIDARYSVFHWRVRFHRAKRLQFSNLSRANKFGFRLYGIGHAVVRTPRLFVPHARYRVGISGKVTHVITANRKGQLRVRVNYGATPHRADVGILRVHGKPIG